MQRRSNPRCHATTVGRIVVVLWLCVAPSFAAMTAPEERDLGEHFNLEARAKLPLVEDVDVMRYLDRIGQRIVANLDDPRFEFTFTAIRDDRINAFAVPGGFVYANAGLLLRAANDDEVAGVLGHEIAHVQARHIGRQQEKTKVLTYASLAALVLTAIQPAIGAGALAASSAAQLKYQREFEQEADYLGARYMQAAGFDARGMLDFFKRLEGEFGTQATLVPPYLLTHPLTQDRLTNLEAVLHERQWDRAPRQAATLELERVRLAAHLALEPAPRVVAAYRERAAAHPDHAASQYLLGLARLGANQFDEARTSFDKAAALGMPHLDRELGRVALGERKLDEAESLLTKATANDENDPLAFRELGRVLEAKGALADALRAYQRAVALAPRMSDAQHSLGMVAGRTGAKGVGFYRLGCAARLRGDYPQALRYLQQADGALAGDATERADLTRSIALLSDFLNPPLFGR